MPFEQRIPRQFTPGGIQAYAPISGGVYGLSNSRNWVFIGQADNIQAALLAQLNDAAAMKQGPTGFVFENCDGAQRTARRDRLIAEYGPTCNRSAPSPRTHPVSPRRNAA